MDSWKQQLRIVAERLRGADTIFFHKNKERNWTTGAVDYTYAAIS